MFIRVKKVKKRSGKIYEYAHLVKGIWRKRRSTIKENGQRGFNKFNNSIHKYKKFLGRVYRFDSLDKDIDYENFFYNFQEFVDNNKISDIYKKLIKYELLCRGFRLKGRIYVRSNAHVDLDRLIVHNGKDDAVVKLKNHSGYLCSLTLDELFKIKKISNRYEGLYLMKRLKSIGIKLDSDKFFILANRLLQEN